MAWFLSKKQWKEFDEMKEGEIVLCGGKKAEILKKNKNSALIKIEISGALISKMGKPKPKKEGSFLNKLYNYGRWIMVR